MVHVLFSLRRKPETMQKCVKSEVFFKLVIFCVPLAVRRTGKPIVRRECKMLDILDPASRTCEPSKIPTQSTRPLFRVSAYRWRARSKMASFDYSHYINVTKSGGDTLFSADITRRGAAESFRRFLTFGTLVADLI